MNNDRNIDFTPSPTLPQGIDFTPDSSYGASSSGDGQTADGGGRLDQAKQTAHRLVSTAQQRATEQVHSRFDAQKMRAAEYASSVAETLRDTSQQFAGNEGITRYINQAADRVENLATYLHDREMDEIVGRWRISRGVSRSRSSAAPSRSGSWARASSRARRGTHAMRTTFVTNGRPTIRPGA